VTPRHHLSVCICTYKRSRLLRQLLLKLGEQETSALFDYSIVVVDNDLSGSAQQTVDSFSQQSNVSISYYVEPRQNIALARNKAIEKASGDFVAFIDDDEFPNEYWLLNLYKAAIGYKSDGILGPVLPYFEEEPPRWVLRGGFFDRMSHPTGHVLEWKNTRTGNVLLKRELFQEGPKWFDPAFGSGGEDRDFFRRKIEEGHIFVWSNDSPVFETVPPERWNKTVMIKRALLRGKVAFENATSKPLTLLKSVLAVTVYSFGLPLFLTLGYHIFMRYLVKDFDHLGKVLTFLGVDLVKEKYVTS